MQCRALTAHTAKYKAKRKRLQKIVLIRLALTLGGRFDWRQWQSIAQHISRVHLELVLSFLLQIVQCEGGRAFGVDAYGFPVTVALLSHSIPILPITHSQR